MKHTSYVVIAPAVQDRFWSTLAHKNRREIDHPGHRRDALVRPLPNHDTGARKKIPFDALVDYCITYSVPWHILELGFEGALVRMDTGGLRVGQTTDFVLRFKCDRRPVEHRIPAVVEAIDAHGVALRFGEYADDTRRDLATLLCTL